MENENKLDRINKEWKLCKKSVTLGSIGASAGPLNKNNLYYWESIISGPNDTPYEGGIFTLTIKFVNNYPFYAPEIKVKPVEDGTIPIFHPNINTYDGTICLSILNDDWNSENTIENCITSIVTLLADYNNDEAAERGWDQEPKELYFKDKNLFIQKAKEYTKKYGDI